MIQEIRDNRRRRLFDAPIDERASELCQRGISEIALATKIASNHVSV